MSNIVLALGGNALGSTPKKQIEAARLSAQTIADILEAGHSLVIVHGNGPQVGMIHTGLELASRCNDKLPKVAYPECGAMSQGYIGYHLQQAIGNELKSRGIKKEICTLITQTMVDENDPAFKNPTKPVGPFYSKEEAHKLSLQGLKFIEDAGRGYRQVIASPVPKKIIEIDTIECLLKAGCLVIAGGGGGIPVNSKGEGLTAVIDKDKTAAKLASRLKADMLMILTAVDKVYINFNKDNQEPLYKLDVAQAQKYLDEGQFAEGSMKPKIEACIDYIKEMKQKKAKALITGLDTACLALKQQEGTIIEM